MSNMKKVLACQQKEFDELNNKIKDFCKKNNYSYMWSMGKYYPEIDHTLVMGDYHTHESVWLEALARKLLEGLPGIAIVSAMMANAEDFHNNITKPQKEKH